MTLARLIFYYLWIAPHVLQGIMLVLILRRRVHRQFPWFFSYTAFEVLQFVVLFGLSRWPATKPMTYFYAYSVGLCISTALRFAILYEVFAHVCLEYASVSRVAKPILSWMMALFLLGSLVLAVYTGGNAADHDWLVLHLLARTALILQVGLLGVLLAFSWYLNLSWRNQAFGIALGFGIFATVDLTATAIRSQTGFAYTALLDYLTMATWHVCVLIWMIYLLAPERPRLPAPTVVPEHQDAEAWNRELERLLHQ